jgi:4-amino-4-deoxy-L-arabinose transferase-like glycosyltransferase
MDPKESWMPMLLLLLFGIAILFQMPQQAADTEIVPDSIEYAFGALNLATGNGYQIQVGGRPLPPRYPPWFSAMLVPAYWILGDDPGNGIVMVFVLAMIGVLAAYKIGERISGPWGGAGAGLLLLVFTDYHYYGRQIMTDVPCTAILLLVLWLGCSIRERPRNWKWGLVGVLLACAAALRPGLRHFCCRSSFGGGKCGNDNWRPLAGCCGRWSLWGCCRQDTIAGHSVRISGLDTPTGVPSHTIMQI